MRPSESPTLQIALRLAGTDLFGAMEWVLASARRTGLTLRQLNFDTAANQRVLATMSAGDSDLLHLFVRRLGNGIDVQVLLAEFSDDELPDEPSGSAAAIATTEEPLAPLALHA